MGSVLVVEDDPGVLALVCDALLQSGHSVEGVATFAEGDQRLSSGAFDLLITNVRLPDGSGIDLADKAQQLGIEAILVTGHPNTMQGLVAQGRTYLQKPFRLDALMRAVEQRIGPAIP